MAFLVKRAAPPGALAMDEAAPGWSAVPAILTADAVGRRVSVPDPPVAARTSGSGGTPASNRPSHDRHRYQAETRSGQLDELAELTNHLVVTHVAVVSAVVYFFWRVSQAYLLGLLCCVLLTLVGTAVGSWLYRRHASSPAAVEAGHRIAPLLVLALGIAWGTVPLVIYGQVDVDHRMIVVAVCAGLIATTFIFGPVPYLSWIFGVPIAAGSFLALIRSGDEVSDILAVLLTVYAAFVLFSATRMTRLAVQRIVDRVRVSEQNETISLLLHEFEENASDWLWETDARGDLLHASERMAQVSGRPLSALRRAPFAALFGEVEGGAPPGEGVAEVIGLVRDRTAFRNHLVEASVAGAVRWWRLSGKPIQDKTGQFIGFRGVGSDIAETRRSEARIAYLASYDPLTGLANRALFHDRATEECLRAVHLKRFCALLYLDLDGFKIVNDTFGHGFGDLLLTQVAQRLEAEAGESALVARLGGDEFALLLPCPGEVEAVALADRLIAAIRAPYAIDGVQVEIGVSIGIALAPRDAQAPQSLLGRADLALYRAKAGGKGAASVFEPALEISLRARRDLEVDLKTALANDEFVLHYQPLVGLEDGRVRSFEALLRWTKPGRGRMSPAEFVPVAEATGLISVIGRWVLREACAEAAGWPQDLRIAVNLSPTQFRNSDLVQDVVAALSASGLGPDRLELEITESVFFEMNAVTVANLRELRALGVRIALDDFGTGYSSLSYLIKFPVDKIKIDRSFIKDMDSRHECRAIIEAILTLAKKLAITVTAEGVETVEQVQMLQRSGCDDIQGFLFSPARPADEVPGLIESLPLRFAEIIPQGRIATSDAG